MVFIILALLSYTALTLFSVAASRSMNEYLVALIEVVMSLVFPVVILVQLLSKRHVEVNKYGVIMACLAGIMIGLFTVFMVKALAVNKVGIVAPVVLGGSIFLTTIMSYFIFKEKVSALQFCGLLFMGIGLIVLIYSRAIGK